jgi:hypothetical protein
MTKKGGPVISSGGPPLQHYPMPGPAVGAECFDMRTTAKPVPLPTSVEAHEPNEPGFTIMLHQAAVLEFPPSKPLFLDSFRSLRTDRVCREDGCARLGLRLQRLSTWLGASY